MRIYLMVFAFFALFAGILTSLALVFLNREPWWFPGLCGLGLFLLSAVLEAGFRVRDGERTNPPQLLSPPPAPQNVRSFIEGQGGRVVPPRPPRGNVEETVVQMPPRPRKKPPGNTYQS